MEAFDDAGTGRIYVLPVLLWSQQVDRYILLLLPNMMSQAAVFDLFENDVSF